MNQDALYANAPNILELKKYSLNFIIVSKNKSLPVAMEKRRSSLEDVVDLKRVEVIGDKVKKTLTREYSYVNDLPMGKEEVSVNFIRFKETLEWSGTTGRKKGQVQREEIEYTWITNIKIDESNIDKLVQAGRSRWKIENEAFNTLKNQGYRLEHNYGHGKLYLANNFAMLAMIAFLIDQVQEAHCLFFKNVFTKWKGKRSRVWRFLEFAICLQEYVSWAELWSFLAKGKRLANTS